MAGVMGREIKFRGLAESGVMVFGDFIHESEACFIKLKSGYFEEIRDSETVGQFTGLKDKNGIDVYEGDIVKRVYYPIGCPSGVEYYKESIIVNNGWSFGLKHTMEGTNVLNAEKAYSYHETKRKVYKHPTQGLGWVDNSFPYNESEVIGNIHQNPGLL